MADPDATNPGAKDGSSKSLEELLRECQSAQSAGLPLDAETLITRYPQYADSLRVFLSSQQANEETTNFDSDELVEATLVAPGPSSKTPAESIPPSESKLQADIGEAFGDYQILGEIARGGMGVIFKAQQIHLNRLVALKMVLAGRHAGDETVSRFYREAEAAAKLDHPNIVPVYDFGEQDGQHYYSMRYIQGQSLADVAKQRKLHGAEAATLMTKIAAAIHYAHQKGVIHRDLKPANVLLDSTGEPKVTDFGLAKEVDFDSDLTATGQIVGTPSYMAPEQAAGQNQLVDARTDVYALGAILYCLVTGKPPFSSPSVVDTLIQVREADPTPPRKAGASIPRKLETIILKCLQKAPAQRYTSAQALGEDLQRFVAGEPIRAKQLGPLGRFYQWTKKRPIAAGCAIGISGLGLIAGGIATIVYAAISLSSSGMDYMKERQTPRQSYVVDVGESFQSPAFLAKAGQALEFQLKTNINTTSYESKIEYDDDGQEQTEYKPKFSARTDYQLVSSNGETLTEGNSQLTHRSVMLYSNKTHNDDSISFATSKQLFRFEPESDQQVRLRAEVTTGDEATQIETAELHVFEVKTKSNKMLQAFFGYIVAGILIGLVGLGFSFYGPILMLFRKQRTSSGGNL